MFYSFIVQLIYIHITNGEAFVFYPPFHQNLFACSYEVVV